MLVVPRRCKSLMLRSSPPILSYKRALLRRRRPKVVPRATVRLIQARAVTVSFPINNIGGGATSNLVATLQNSGGVTPITTSQTYGTIPGMAAARKLSSSSLMELVVELSLPRCNCRMVRRVSAVSATSFAWVSCLFYSHRISIPSLRRTCPPAGALL